MKLFDLYKTDFRYDSEETYNIAKAEMLSAAEEYLRYLLYAGTIPAIIKPDIQDVSKYLVMEMLITDNNQFIKLKDQFDEYRNTHADEDPKIVLLMVLYCEIINNIGDIYKYADYKTRNLFKELEKVIKDLNLQKTIIFKDSYLHRKPVNFESGECIDCEKLTELLKDKFRNDEFNPSSFLNYVFDNLESNNEYLHAIPYSHLIKILGGYKNNGSNN